jgi:hypothetical protein
MNGLAILQSNLKQNSSIIVNALIFQVVWFACVLGGAADQPLWGFLGVSALVALSMRGPTLAADLRVMLGLGTVGFVLDSTWVLLGVLDYGGSPVAPAWIVALWLGFALTVNHSMGWLKRNLPLAAALAAVFAPVTYLAGERLGAVAVTSLPGLALVSIAWALLFYVTFGKAQRLLAPTTSL